jgi:hypothetical protein
MEASGLDTNILDIFLLSMASGKPTKSSTPQNAIFYTFTSSRLSISRKSPTKISVGDYI